MSLFVFDTDHLTLFQSGHVQVLKNVTRHLTDQLAISIITTVEQLSGWQAALRQAKNDARREANYRRMASAVESLASWRVLPHSVAAMARHAKFIRQHLNIGSNDLKIGACALEYSATVVTHNVRDFSRIPGLTIEDWSV